MTPSPPTSRGAPRPADLTSTYGVPATHVPMSTGIAPSDLPLKNGVPLSTLRRIATTHRETYAGERCEMCGEPIGDRHQHVVDLETRGLLCACRGCYLLFTTEGAQQRHRGVPERYLSFPRFRLSPGQWEALEIPVGLAFFFHNSVQDRTIAFYPGPAGATESELPLGAWQSVVADTPALGVVAPDTEALMIRVQGPGRPLAEALLVPIDSCYELVGQLRQVWRGFDGGQDARACIELWFARCRDRSRPAGEGS
jgi:Family of unknown function (DUF5947)